MSRPLRIQFPGAYYHVMNRGLAYQSIFKTNRDWETFLNLLGDVQEVNGSRRGALYRAGREKVFPLQIDDQAQRFHRPIT